MTPSSPIPHDPATAPVTDHSADKPVDEWVTGDEPMTGPQRSYLQTLAREAGEELPERELNKAQASELIADGGSPLYATHRPGAPAGRAAAIMLSLHPRA